MLPLTLLAPSKIADLLSDGDAFADAIASAAHGDGIAVPIISPDRVLLSSASPDIADTVSQFSYPRMCLYSGGLKNSLIEKFRPLSGSLSVIVDIWSSGNFLSDTDRWIHYYVDAFTNIMSNNAGDWGDGLYFPGSFDVSFQQPKRGGFGFVQMAKVTCSFLVSR